jgi:hypothetical protein
MHLLPVIFILLALFCTSCVASNERSPSILHAQLSSERGEGFEELSAAFAAANPGYEIEWHPQCSAISAADADRVIFVQGPLERTQAPTVGDIVLLRAGETWELEGGGAVDLLGFRVPGRIPHDLPGIIRPDWDPAITDVPGGCAEETGAYRRILLTWLEEKGPYVLHSLNAHRVRINDSFSHYHPVDGGFDELYLVQMAGPKARVLTSEKVAEIESGEVEVEDLDGLITTRTLEVGDLVYMPRGTMHRGVGGALVQVISVPGFVPNAEIGLDHHLRSINERLGLEPEQALPLHAAASTQAVVK